ncbi:MAG TPA: SAM-dependent methyltransferase [Flavobacteriales bacterium]|jgi:hypothetical protein|nr:SAM-dependent methyltransferase [Flavobacteriales bacterium]
MRDSDDYFNPRFEAQKIAFAPVVFHVALSLRNLGVLDALRKSRKLGLSIPQLKRQLQISEYGLSVLLELALLTGIVEQKEDAHFILTETGKYIELDPLTKVNFDFINDICYKGLAHLEESILKSKPEGLKELGHWETIYQGLSEMNQQAQKSWLAFDHYYSTDSSPELLQFLFSSAPKTLVDIGGNDGRFALNCCKHNPEVQITIVDLPGQIQMAKSRIEGSPYDSRIEYISMDILKENKPLPKADAVWMSQFLDCFSESEVRDILKYVGRQIDLNTNVYIIETLWDQQEHPASSFSVAATSVYFTTMANGNSKMFSAKKLRALINESGLQIIDEVFPIGMSHTLFHCKVKPV